MIRTCLANTLIVTALLLVSARSSIAVDEHRCAELGANCLCSNQFDTDGYANSNLVDPNRYNVIPDDIGNKGCNPGWFADKDIQINTAASSPLPASATLSFVWEAIRRSGISDITHRGGVTSNTRRICERHYVHYQSDYDFGCTGGSAPASKKVVRFLADDVGGAMFLQNNGNSFFLEPTIGTPGPDEHLTGNLDPTPDCVDGWCFVQMCASGDILARNNITITAEVRQLDFPFHVSTATRNMGSMNPDYTRTGIENYREGCTRGGGREISLVLVAAWNTDTGQKIGPAFEMEGGLLPVPAPTNLRAR